MSRFITNNRSIEIRSTRDPVRSSAHSNMFGSIAGNRSIVPVNVDFIPADNDGHIIDMTGGIEPQWLGLQSKHMQFWAYVYCTPLAAVIDRLAEAYTNGIVELRDEDGVTLKKKSWRLSPEKSRLMKLIKKPNPFQTWQEFHSQQKVLCKIFGYCPVFAVSPAGMDKTYTKYLWNLNPLFCNPVRNDEFDLITPTNQIKHWTLELWGKTYGEIPPQDILIVKDGFVDAVGPGAALPLSKIAGLDHAVSNILAAMEADNVLLKKKGPLGVFSYDQKPDMAGQIPMTPGKKDELQEDLRRYGLSWNQLQYVVSKLPLKWNAMSFNLRDLMTKETARQGIDMICDRMGYPAELMSGKNATYENRSSAEKYMYQNNIIPFSLRTMDRYNEFFGIADDYSLYMDYQHLPVLQEDIVSAGNAYKANTEALFIEWQAGQITWNQWQQAQNRDTVAGMDIFYPEWAKKNGIDLNPPKPQTSKDESKKP